MIINKDEQSLRRRTAKQKNKGKTPTKGKRSKKKTLKKKEGRPTKITKTVLQKLEQAFSLGCSDLEACILAKISPSTLYEFQKVNKEFSERKALLKNKPILKARKTVVSKLHNIGAATWFLERRRKDEFSTKVETDMPEEMKESLMKTQKLMQKIANSLKQ